MYFKAPYSSFIFTLQGYSSSYGGTQIVHRYATALLLCCILRNARAFAFTIFYQLSYNSPHRKPIHKTIRIISAVVFASLRHQLVSASLRRQEKVSASLPLGQLNHEFSYIQVAYPRQLIKSLLITYNMGYSRQFR